MQETLLHHIWNFKKFDFLNATTQQGQQLIISSVGIHNTTQSGPDFFNAKLKIDDQLWAGNVELHLKSSDWYAHRHEKDPAYDNVILHVVWEHDVEIYRKDGQPIPTLTLKELVSESLLRKAQKLLSNKTKWIACEDEFPLIEEFTLSHWLERMYLERLEEKSNEIERLVEQTQSNWEEVLFLMLAKNFGLNVNGSFFYNALQSLPFNVFLKTRHNRFQLEALVFGQCNLLQANEEVFYVNSLLKEYNYLVKKFKLENHSTETPKFFRLRPDNFPTIRLAQFVELYASNSNLFSKIIECTTLQEIETVFKIEVSEFWQTHYSFTSSHKQKKKQLSKAFVTLLIINTIIPLTFFYNKKNGLENTTIINWMRLLPLELNNITKGYIAIYPSLNANALCSQGLIHMKRNYCDKLKCLNCEIGLKIIKK